MKFSLNKVFPFLLPLIQVVSGTALTDTTGATLSSLRLVGSFSIGIEGAATPLTFTHNLNVPLAPIAQHLLNCAQPRDTLQTQPAITESPHVSEPSTQDRVLVVRGGDHEGLPSTPSTPGTTSGPRMKTLEDLEHDRAIGADGAFVILAEGDGVEVGFWNDGTDIAGSMEDALDEAVAYETERVARKRKLEGEDGEYEDMSEAVVKRRKWEDWNEDVEVDHEAVRKRFEEDEKKKRGERKERKRERRRKCCEHCKGGD